MPRKTRPKHRKTARTPRTSYQPKKQQQRPATYSGPQTDYEYGF